MLVLINRREYWQCGSVIEKGSADQLKQRGIAAFREQLATIAPFFRDRLDELHDWSSVSLLTVQVDRLLKWHRPGLLCIGDAAHAMSPIGGVGINLAIQDAIAAANLLAEPLRQGRLEDGDLARVQRRREFPTRATQSLQIFLQNRVVAPVLWSRRPLEPPLASRLLDAAPPLRCLPARLIGWAFALNMSGSRPPTPVVARSCRQARIGCCGWSRITNSARKR